MAAKLLNLLALASLAIVACSFGATPANALSLDTSPNHARHLGHHQLIAKKKRADTRRCKPRPSSSSVAVAVSTTHPVVVTTSTTPVVVVPTTTPKPTSVKTTTTHKASSSAAATPAPAPVGNAGGGKAGLGWPNGDSVPLKNFVTKKVSTVYSWSPFKPANSDALGLQFAPMLWGSKQASDFKRLVVAGYANWALGMNEPDHSGQANMSPGDAANLWRQYLEPLKSKGYNLVSPAVTSGSSGKPWLQSFLGACSDCNVDRIAVHWYGTDANAFIAYVKDFHTTFGKPIWVTEFACNDFSGNNNQCSAAQSASFMDAVTGFMDGADYVEQYFAFGFMHDMGNVNPLEQLMGSDNQPTALGWNYLT